MRGNGNGAPVGGVPGDLLIVVEELSHDQFQRGEKISTTTST